MKAAKFVHSIPMTVADVQRYMQQHYEKGGHMLIECWEDEDILEWLNERKRTENSLKGLLRELNGISAEKFSNNWH